MSEFRVLAEYLVNAEMKKQAVPCITGHHSGFTLEKGYRVQNELVKIKKELGHKVIAYKMGLTSQAKMRQMKINEPIYGYVFDYMKVENNGHMKIDDYIHPKVEVELAFILNEDIIGPSVTGEEVLAKTKWVIPAFEIIDSRYENFTFKLPDVVADNTSAAGLVLGNTLLVPCDVNVDAIGVSLKINGEIRASGISSAVLGNPAYSVAMLANMLWNNGKRKLEKGSFVLTGGITEAVLLQKGDHVKAEFDGMGEVSFDVI
jgi:2-oxo-3-hexenedioate decarboxylase